MLSCFSCVRLFAILWTVACQAPLSVGFLTQENSSDLPFPSPRDLPDSGIEPASLSLLHWLCAYSLSCVRLCNPMDCGPPRLLCPWDSPNKNMQNRKKKDTDL